MDLPLTYLEFDLHSPAQREAVLRAADKLSLRVEHRDDGRFMVSVDSAMTAYRLGLVTAPRMKLKGRKTR